MVICLSIKMLVFKCNIVFTSRTYEKELDDNRYLWL